MNTLPPKQALRDELVTLLEGTLAALERAHQGAREAATHEESRPENDKDTRALEQSYLARGQAMRIDELRSGLAAVRNMPTNTLAATTPAALGAIVRLEETGTALVVFVAPHGGGTMLAGGTVQVVTPQSPLGRSLVGKRAGDEISLRLAERVRELEVLAVA